MQRTRGNSGGVSAQQSPAAASDATRPAARWRRVIVTTLRDFQDDQATRCAAAIAFYSLFSIAPLLLIVTAIVGSLFGEKAIVGQIHQQLEGFIGRDGAALVEDLVARAHQPGAGLAASIIGVAALLWGASSVFGEVRDALNSIWEVKPSAAGGWASAFIGRLIPFSMLLVIGFLLLVSLVIDTILAAAATWAKDRLIITQILSSTGNVAASLVIVTVLFALVFRYLPDARMPWRHIAMGAAVTAVLFTIGKYLLGWYLGRNAISSTYGAAGSVVGLLLWAYYSSLILLLGAEFTQAHACVFGHRLSPPCQPAAESTTEQSEARTAP